MTPTTSLATLRQREMIIAASLFLVTLLGILALVLVPEGSKDLVLGLCLMALIGLLVWLLVVQKNTRTLTERILSQVAQSDDEKFRSLYDQSPTPYVTIDAEGAISMFNPAAVSLFGSTVDVFGTQNFFSYIAEYTDHDVSVLHSKIRTGITVSDAEVRLMTNTSEPVWALLSVYQDTVNQQYIVSLVDISQAKKIDTAKSEFVALATHQLRTPIAAVRWNHELLESNLSDSERERTQPYLSKIERNILRMIALINDFLSASQLEMGTYAAQEARLNLDEFFDDIVDEFSEKIAAKEIRVERKQTPPQFTMVTDSRLFHIIVSNLMSNAVKYTTSGGTLTLQSAAAGDTVSIVIADTGIGVPEAEQEKLFSRFFRATNARDHQVQGTGLGLYLVKQAVEKLGGRIEVVSVENQGTTFTVTLPVVSDGPAVETPSGQRSPMSPTSDSASSSPRWASEQR